MDSIKHRLMQLSCLFVVIFCIISAFPVDAASEKQDSSNQFGRIQITLASADKVIPNVKISLYRVFDISEDKGEMKIALSHTFEKFPITAETDSEKIGELITTLEGLIASNSIQPDETGVTDETGKVSFNSVLQGGYLITGDKFEQDGTVVFPTSSFVTLPFKDNEGNLKYDIRMNMKCEKQEKTKKTSIETMKVWNDNNSKERPKSITVELYCDGKLYQTQTLSESNNWKYKWENLDAGSKWVLSEKNIPDNYRVLVSRQGNSFLVTNSIPNTYTPKTPSGTLPQTGVLFWPIPLLAVTGVVFIIIGFVLKRDNNVKK